MKRKILRFGKGGQIGSELQRSLAPCSQVITTVLACAAPAQCPLNSRPDITRLRETFGLNLPDWRISVDRMLQEIL